MTQDDSDSDILRDSTSPLHAYLRTMLERSQQGERPRCTFGEAGNQGVIALRDEGFHYEGVFLIGNRRLRIGKCTLALLDTQIPETFSIPLAGRKLMETIVLPPCGVDVIDRSLRNMTITKAQNLPDGVEITLKEQEDMTG